MDRTTIVRLSPEPTQTRLLVTQGSRDIGKAILPGTACAHPRAAATLLEGLSLYLGERLSVVLCVDERSPSSCAHGLLDGLGYGERGLHYEVGVAMRGAQREQARARRASRIDGIGDFRDLRQLHWVWSR